MYRALAVLAIALLPTAAAVEVSIQFDVVVEDPSATGYYVRFRTTEFEAPREPSDADDCAADDRPKSAENSAERTTAPIAQTEIDPFTFHSFHEQYPGCIAVSTRSATLCNSPLTTACAPPAYVAYDVATGRYLIEGSTPLGIAPGLPTFGFAAQFGFGGNSGFGSDADCEACPPPMDLAP